MFGLFLEVSLDVSGLLIFKVPLRLGFNIIVILEIFGAELSISLLAEAQQRLVFNVFIADSLLYCGLILISALLFFEYACCQQVGKANQHQTDTDPEVNHLISIK